MTDYELLSLMTDTLANMHAIFANTLTLLFAMLVASHLIAASSPEAWLRWPVHHRLAAGFRDRRLLRCRRVLPAPATSAEQRVNR